MPLILSALLAANSNVRLSCQADLSPYYFNIDERLFAYTHVSQSWLLRRNATLERLDVQEKLSDSDLNDFKIIQFELWRRQLIESLSL